MTELSIDLNPARSGFTPGEEVAGTVSWSTDKPGEKVELRLFWFTRGKGTEDAGIVDTQSFEGSAARESRPFRFRLPAGPYSFSGQLISLVWALELVLASSKKVVRREFVVGPGGREVRLTSVPLGAKSTGWLTLQAN